VSIFNILLPISEKEWNWYLQIVTNLSVNNLKYQSGKLIHPKTAQPQTVKSQFSSSKFNVQTVLELVTCVKNAHPRPQCHGMECSPWSLC
jgi:hypothetical protein